MQDETATKLTNALIQQSITGERVAVALERFEARLSVPLPAQAPATLSVGHYVAAVCLAALVGACSALVWP